MKAKMIFLVMIVINSFPFFLAYSQKIVLSNRELEMQTINTNGVKVIFQTKLLSSICWDQDGRVTNNPIFTSPEDLEIKGDYQGFNKG